jgi:serine/threonine protein kinase
MRTTPSIECILRVVNVIQCQTNVLVNEAGHAVLTDFGRAKVIGQQVYSTPMMAGTAKYMAPELLPLSGEVNIDELFSKKSDVYAFGMLCFEVSDTMKGKS